MVGRDAAGFEQFGAVTPGEHRLTVAVLILDEFERAPVGP